VEVKLLRSMLRWATTVRIGNGQRLLNRNPLDGIRGFRESNPQRPIATYDRFVKTREAIIATRSAAGCTPRARRRSLLLELGLVLAHATGRRLGSIRQLRWDDIDISVGTIRWRASSDKQRRELIVPIPPSLVDELRFFRREMGTGFGELVFPSENDAATPIRRDVFDKWLRKAEEKAGLPSLVGGLWHPYRRGWATSRKHHSVADVAAAGGWKDLNTLTECYMQADNDTMLAVMSEPKKLRDNAAVG
jgi:integrase